MNLKYTISLIIGLLLVSNANANGLQALDGIEQAAYEYALKQAQSQFDNPQVVMGTLDSRLRLQDCESDLEVFNKTTNSMMGNQTIGVKCSSPISWTIYVPVKVKVFKSVIVASRTLLANSIITKEDLALEQRDISLLRQGFVEKSNQLVGQQLKYAMTSGTVLRINSVKPQKIVRRGDLITLIASTGKMEIRMSGTALSDAKLGQRIKVKNSSSKRIVEGIVEAPGIVKVTM